MKILAIDSQHGYTCSATVISHHVVNMSYSSCISRTNQSMASILTTLSRQDAVSMRKRPNLTQTAPALSLSPAPAAKAACSACLL